MCSPILCMLRIEELLSLPLIMDLHVGGSAFVWVYASVMPEKAFGLTIQTLVSWTLGKRVCICTLLLSIHTCMCVSTAMEMLGGTPQCVFYTLVRVHGSLCTYIYTPCKRQATHCKYNRKISYGRQIHLRSRGRAHLCLCLY